MMMGRIKFIPKSVIRRSMPMPRSRSRSMPMSMSKSIPRSIPRSMYNSKAPYVDLPEGGLIKEKYHLNRQEFDMSIPPVLNNSLVTELSEDNTYTRMNDRLQTNQLKEKRRNIRKKCNKNCVAKRHSKHQNRK